MFFLDNYYSLREITSTAFSFVLTKIYNRPASLIRRPFILRGACRCQFGAGFTTGRNCRIETFGGKGDKAKRLIIGSNVHIGDNVHIAASNHVEIGDNCLFASKVFIGDSDHGFYGGSNPSRPDSDPNTRPLDSAPITIGANVWLAENVCVLKGTTIGDGAIIGSNAVVTKDIPPASIAVGAPARVVKRFDFESGMWVKA